MQKNDWENQYSEVNELKIDVDKVLSDLNNSGRVDSYEDAVRIVNNRESVTRLTIEQALQIVTRQMEIAGLRKITINDYRRIVEGYQKVTGIQNISAIDEWSIYDWLDSMKVSQQTKLTKQKCFKAFLSKCLHNGMYKRNFWSHIVVKVDKRIIQGADTEQVKLLMGMLDLNTFVGLRDYLAISLMINNGVRVGTISLIPESAVDYSSLTLNLDGSIMKNRKPLIQPITKKTAALFKILSEHNLTIRRENRIRNDYLFISAKGIGTSTQSGKRNMLRDRLRIYCERYNLDHMTPHDLRRAYSRNLYDKGATVLEISKALSHSSLAVTTDYLFMSNEETSNNLRKYLID